MARPNKLRLDYFPLDVDIFDDEKVSAISAEFGYKAEIIIIKLLCSIYRNGYYYGWDDVHRGFFLSKLRGVSESLLDNVIKRLVTYGFFDKQLFDKHKILTSVNIQEIYFSATSRRRHILSEYPFILISVRNDNKSATIPKEPDRIKPLPVKKVKEKENTYNNTDDNVSIFSSGSDDSNKRNYSGLIQRLKDLHVPDENIRTIASLSDGGRIGHKVWKILSEIGTNSSGKIRLPGPYIISKLNGNEEKNIDYDYQAN